MAATDVRKVYNHDIVGIYNRMNRMEEELSLSVSSGTSQMNIFDQERLVSYLDNLEAYKAFVIGSPSLDLPESHPREYTLKPLPVRRDVESEDIETVIELISLGREEIINSQSARDPAGLNKFDAGRFDAIMLKIRSYLTSVVSTSTPIDLPESSPMASLSPAGRTGV